MFLEAIPLGIWFMLPAYAANPMAVLFGGGRPMDSGRTLKDGRRLFGDGKTWRGFAGGTIMGVLIGALQQAGAVLAGEELALFDATNNFIAVIAIMSLGSMTGDLLGSFVKRRLGIDRGAKTPLLDIYTFLVVALVLLLVFEPGWTLAHFFYGERILSLLTVIIVTPILHRGINIIGHRMGKKAVPW